MTRFGGCKCGQVRYEIRGEPTRTGLCHCETCRKDTGSAFSFFGFWPRASVTLSGELGGWRSRAGLDRFCPRCGSSLFCFDEGSQEIEVKLGTLDGGPSEIIPRYELWTIRREHWLVPVDAAERHDRDRPKRS